MKRSRPFFLAFLLLFSQATFAQPLAGTWVSNNPLLTMVHFSLTYWHGAESSAVVYAISVLGARTNRNSGVLELLCGVVGRAPKYGLLTNEGRMATWVVEVKTSKKPEAQILETRGAGRQGLKSSSESWQGGAI